ncbi:MAG: hypothetical protein KIH63_000990 [Candidatus Saccharibacteria bacterium]|nr:hypothetical protein [Candidatus Saccharibacteria bacterium]
MGIRHYNGRWSTINPQPSSPPPIDVEALYGRKCDEYPGGNAVLHTTRWGVGLEPDYPTLVDSSPSAGQVIGLDSSSSSRIVLDSQVIDATYTYQAIQPPEIQIDCWPY